MIEPGAVVWLVLATAAVVWLSLAVLCRRRLIGPVRLVRWTLASWTSRLVILAAWGGAGWHIFCQRP